MKELNVKLSLILTQAAPKEIQIDEEKKLIHKEKAHTVYANVPQDPNEINIDSDSDSIDTTKDNENKQDSSIQRVESTPDEKLMREYLDKAFSYHSDRKSTKPNLFMHHD